MDFNQFTSWAMKALLGAALAFCVHFLGDISQSISLLNERVAAVIERTDSLKGTVQNVEHRLERVERFYLLK